MLHDWISLILLCTWIGLHSSEISGFYERSCETVVQRLHRVRKKNWGLTFEIHLLLENNSLVTYSCSSFKMKNNLQSRKFFHSSIDKINFFFLLVVKIDRLHDWYAVRRFFLIDTVSGKGHKGKLFVISVTVWYKLREKKLTYQKLDCNSLWLAVSCSLMYHMITTSHLLGVFVWSHLQRE